MTTDTSYSNLDIQSLGLAGIGELPVVLTGAENLKPSKE